MTSATLSVASTSERPRRNYEMADVHHLASRIMLYLLVLTAVSVVGFPLLWMVLCSFKLGGELYATPPTFLPSEWTLQNYRDLFVQTNFPIYFANSLIVAGRRDLSLAPDWRLGRHSLSRFKFFGIAAFSNAALICYMLPEVLVLPLYIYVVKLGLADTLFALIVANTAYLPLALWFMRSYFNAIPVSLEESAMIDGCTRLQAMYRVTVPLALPGVISVGVFSFNHAWNEFLFALVFTSSERNKTAARPRHLDRAGQHLFLGHASGRCRACHDSRRPLLPACSTQARRRASEGGARVNRS